MSPVSSYMYEETGASCLMYALNTGLLHSSTKATWATDRALCCTPVATHSTSMLNTGWPGGMLIITGGEGAWLTTGEESAVLWLNLQSLPFRQLPWAKNTHGLDEAEAIKF